MQGQGIGSQSRLFGGMCLAVVTLAFSFATLSGALYEMKGEFQLDNTQIGLIGGAGLWGMAISQLGFSSLCDVVGMRHLMRLALLGHVAGAIMFLVAGGFGGLFAAALILAIANGVVEAVGNPLVATLYPDRKAGMLNRLHLWFPGGIAIAGIAVWLLDIAHIDWRAKMVLPLIPAAGYAWLLLRATFPPTECARGGQSAGDAVRAVLTTSILWLFLILMMVTMSLELGPNRWIPAVLEAGGMPGILVLVLINGIMALMRANAHAILDRVPPAVLLALCTAIAGAGLWWLSISTGFGQAIAAALVFALGISMVWPTMMGFVAERAPRTGALGLGMMAAAGSLALGLFTTPMLGRIADDHLPTAVPAAQLRTIAAAAVSASDPALADAAKAALADPSQPQAVGTLLRRAAAGDAGPGLAATAGPLLAHADNVSGLYAFRYLVPFAALVSIIFALVALRDRRRGGHAAEVARVRISNGVQS